MCLYIYIVYTYIYIWMIYNGAVKNAIFECQSQDELQDSSCPHPSAMERASFVAARRRRRELRDSILGN